MLKLYTDGTARARGVGRCNFHFFWRRSGGVIHNNGNAARSRLADGRMRGKQGNEFVSNMTPCRTGGWGSRSPTERGGNRELGMFPRARWARKTRSSGTCCRRPWSIGADGIAKTQSIPGGKDNFKILRVDMECLACSRRILRRARKNREPWGAPPEGEFFSAP